ncbi:hypothetical protein [Candidatus Uabimicrobium sp. HlEnr_7]|uniref:hypothetical protein n=1 Tax=Candidatus Uabimicrobium helgolandensis TaxID=3095367 RepID=UPI003557C7ED
MVIELDFSEEITPLEIVRSDSLGKIEGKKVFFNPTDLHPKEKKIFHIKARAIKRGDSRIKAFMRSYTIWKRPVVEEESTHVY